MCYLRAVNFSTGMSLVSTYWLISLASPKTMDSASVLQLSLSNLQTPIQQQLLSQLSLVAHGYPKVPNGPYAVAMNASNPRITKILIYVC